MAATAASRPQRAAHRGWHRYHGDRHYPGSPAAGIAAVTAAC